jgi:4-oxalocrotonate tautomerase
MGAPGIEHRCKSSNSCALGQHRGQHAVARSAEKCGIGDSAWRTRSRRCGRLKEFESQSKGEPTPEVFVHAVEGRTPEQKRALMKEITDAGVRNFDALPEAVVVTIVESLRVNKAKAGVPFSER